jgi:hypothetical protein
VRKAYVPGEKPGDLTLGQFLTNPTGTGSSAVANRGRTIADLRARFDKLMRSNEGKMRARSFRDGSAFVVHVEVPSETFGQVKYDVLMEATPPEGEGSSSSTITDWTIRFWSNSPAFTFTYAHVVDKMGLLLPMARPKCSPASLTDEPKVRNPVQELGFEKSVYFAILYMRETGLTMVSKLGTVSINKKELLDQVTSSDAKLAEFRKAQLDQSAGRKAAKSKELGSSRGEVKGVKPTRSAAGNSRQVRQVKTTSATKKTRSR